MKFLRLAAFAMLGCSASSATAQVIVAYGWVDGSLSVLSLRKGITTFEVRGPEMIPENIAPEVLTSPFDRIDAVKLFKMQLAPGFRHLHFGNVLPPHRSIYSQLVIDGSVVARDGQASSFKEEGLLRLVIPADPLAMLRFVLGWLTLF